MRNMETLDLSKIRQSLLENREILLKRIEQEDAVDKTANPARSDLAWRYDLGQRKELLLSRAKQQLSEVEAALQRLEDGEYGKCVECGQPIHPERLEVLPTAAFCVHCKHQQE